MEIRICETAGLCAGASRSYGNVVNNLSGTKRVVVYKQLLHNESLIEDLKDRGALFTEDLSEIQNDDLVVLRAHGEEKFVYDNLNDRGITFIDSICVNVKRIHDLATQKAKEGYYIIILGNIKNGKIHDEVKGLMTFLENKTLISNINDASSFVFDEKEKYYLVSQTTFSRSLFEEIVGLMSEKAKKQNIEFVPCNTICNFTALNLKNSIELAKWATIAVVVGSKNSSNTMEIYSGVKDICHTIFSNDFDDIKNQVKDFVNVNNIDFEDMKICLLAGASTLKSDLKKLEIQLKFHLV